LPLWGQATGVTEHRRQQPSNFPDRKGAGLNQAMGQQISRQGAKHPIQHTLIDERFLHREKGCVIPGEHAGILFRLPDRQNEARRLELPPIRPPVSALHRRIVQNPLNKREGIQYPICIADPIPRLLHLHRIAQRRKSPEGEGPSILLSPMLSGKPKPRIKNPARAISIGPTTPPPSFGKFQTSSPKGAARPDRGNKRASPTSPTPGTRRIGTSGWAPDSGLGM